MSKGSTRRPQQIPGESFEAAFERIFGKKCKKCGKKYTPNEFHRCKDDTTNDTASSGNPER